MKNHINSKQDAPPPPSPMIQGERTMPINEKEVDMVLGILAHYYQSIPECLGNGENGCRDMRLEQLNIRKNQLEFLLNKTVQEMEKLQ